jgi:hypothetical protein
MDNKNLFDTILPTEIFTTLKDGITFLQLSKKFIVIKPLLKKMEARIKRIYTLMDLEKRWFYKLAEDSSCTMLDLVMMFLDHPEAWFQDIQKPLFVKKLSLRTIASLYRKMKRCFKFLHSSSMIEPILTSPTPLEERPESLRLLTNLTLSELFLSKSIIETLKSLSSLTKLCLSFFEFDDELWLNDLKLDIFITHIDISKKIGKHIIPPSNTKFYELMVCRRNFVNQPVHNRLFIYITNCSELRFL